MEENNFLKIDFDSSSLTAANISEEQFEAGIQEKVQLILQKEFPETRQKQYIGHCIPQKNKLLLQHS